MLWSFLFEQASGFAGGTVDTSIQQLCLSAGLCLLYFVVSQQLMFYFQRRLLKQINTQLKQDVFHALMRKGEAKFTEKNSAVYLSVLNNDVVNLENRLLKQINTQLKQDVFHALMRKGEAKFTEKNSAVYLSVLNNDVVNLENNYFAKIPEILQNGFVFLTCRKGEAKFTEKNSAVYLSVLNNDVVNLENNYFAKIPEILQNGFVFLTCTGVLCYYDVRIVCLVILTALLPVAVPFLIGEKLSKKSKELYEELENYNRKLKDWMGGFEVIHSFQVEDEVKKRFAKSVEDVEKRRYEGRRYQNPYGILTLLLTYLILSIQLFVSAYLVFTGSISERMLLSIFYLISSVNNPIREIAYLLLDVKAAIPNARKVETLLNERPEESKKTGEPVKSVMPLELKEVRFGYTKEKEVLHGVNVCFEKGKKYAIVGSSGCGKSTLLKLLANYYKDYEGEILILKEVRFGYTKEKEVLHGVNVCFEKGKKYAIVGSSGCGKSTLLKLLANYYKDYEGEILIGKQELRTIDRKSLSRKMAMIHQNVFLFEDTLRANITMFQEYPDEEIKAAVKKAELEKIVEDNPLGMEQMVCENGNNFSGGEKQRIAIARAILTRAEVLLLDEATSSLDAELSMQIEQLILSQKETTMEKQRIAIARAILTRAEVLLLDEATSSLDAELSMQIEQLILSQKETTILNVTHRFHESILKQYDCILTMHQGKIVEMGTFEELMKKKQFFYSLYTVNR